MFIYCLFCETTKCRYVAQIVTDLFHCRTIRPRQVQHTWARNGSTKDMVQDLLPGYVFVYSEEPLQGDSLRSVRGVIRCLCNSSREYELTGQDEAFALLLLEKDGIIGKTRVFEEGQRIRICEGAFAGTGAEILKVEKRLSRMLIQIPFAQRLVKTWVEYEIVQAEEEASIQD